MFFYFAQQQCRSAIKYNLYFGGWILIAVVCRICQRIIFSNKSVITFFYQHQQKRMSVQSSGLAQELDLLIKTQYHQICFNPNKRDVLLRLTEKQQDIIGQGFCLPINKNGHMDNRTINQYVQSVYQKYSIEDPIDREFRLAAGRESKIIKSGLHTPEKPTNLSEISHNSRSSKTKKKLAQLKDNYRKGTQDIVVSSQYSHRSRERTSLQPKQIGYRTKEKISFKSIISTSDYEPLQPVFNLNQIQTPKVALKFNSHHQSQSQNIEVPVIFRYCPMCQDIVLEHNISYHQSMCPYIHKAYKMPYAQLEQLIHCKITRMQKDIESKFLSRDDDSFVKEYKRTKQQVSGWLKKDESVSYDHIRASFNSLAMSSYHQLTKLNWFRNLHKKLVEQKQRETIKKQ